MYGVREGEGRMTKIEVVESGNRRKMLVGIMSTTSFLGVKRRRNGSKPECTEYVKGKDE